MISFGLFTGMICEQINMQLPVKKVDSLVEDQKAEPREMLLKKTESLVADHLALPKWKQNYIRDRAKILARRKHLRTINAEHHRSEERRMYKARQEARGFTVDPKFGKPVMTPQQRKAAQLVANAKFRDRNRESLRKRWREKFQKKKAFLKKNDPIAFSKLVERQRNYDKMYRQREKKKRRKWNDEYVLRNKDNIQFMLLRRLRARVRVAVRKQYGDKAGKTVNLIGCSVAAVRLHLESLFKDGMNWERFLKGDIEIDHIIPCAAFDLTDPEQQKKCFHYTNLQPLWTLDNLIKGDKLPDGTRPRSRFLFDG